MKDIFKEAAVKIIFFIVIIVFLLLGIYLLYHRLAGNVKTGHNKGNYVQTIQEKLELTAELNTGSYLCTDIVTKTDSRTINDWEIPLTEKSFIISYDGTVKAGIKDLTKAQVTEKGNTIIVKLPEVEITEAEIDNDSFEKLDESNNLFNPISIEDLNEAQRELKEEMIDNAREKGILDIARNNAEAIISGMLASPGGEYDVTIEWLE